MHKKYKKKKNTASTQANNSQPALVTGRDPAYLEDAEGLADEADAGGRALHGLDDGDVGRRERVERGDGRVEDRHRLGEVGVALVLDRRRGVSLLVRDRLCRARTRDQATTYSHFSTPRRTA